MAKEDALSTSDALQDWISTFGKPDFLMSDGGPAFRNLVISSLTSALKIDHHFVTAYSSWANGKQERLNYTIGKAFRALLSENLMSTTHWHLLVPIVQSVINQTPVASLSWVSPAQAFLACEQANPISSFTDDQGILRHVAWEKSEFLSKVKEWQEEATAREAFLHETQVQRNAKLIERQAAKGRTREFVGEVGDYVMVRKPKKHLSKLERRWRGPAQIISFDEEAPKFVLVVRYLGEHGRRSPTEKVHVDRVRFFDLASMIVTEELKTHAEATSDLRYDVERFNDVRWSNKKKCFELEVYWEGYEDPTWEPLGRMREDVPDMVQNFLATGVPAKSQHLLTEIMRDVGAHTRLVKKKGSVAGTEPEPVSM